MDPPAAPFEPLEQFGVPERFWVHLVVRGQTLGMLLELRRVSGVPGLQSSPIGLSRLGMQDEDRRRDLAAFQQDGHGDP